MDLDCTACLDVDAGGGGGMAGKATTCGCSSKAIQTRAWEILVGQDLEVDASCPGHGPRAVDFGPAPTMWYGIV